MSIESSTPDKYKLNIPIDDVTYEHRLFYQVAGDASGGTMTHKVLFNYPNAGLLLPNQHYTLTHLRVQTTDIQFNSIKGYYNALPIYEPDSPYLYAYKDHFTEMPLLDSLVINIPMKYNYRSTLSIGNRLEHIYLNPHILLGMPLQNHALDPFILIKYPTNTNGKWYYTSFTLRSTLIK